MPLAQLRTFNNHNTQPPANPPPPGTLEVYSPQTGATTLKRYGEISDSAQRALFMTFAFGMNKTFVPVYMQEDSVLRFALMDKEGSGRGAEQASETIAQIRALRNAVIAVGQNITMNELDR